MKKTIRRRNQTQLLSVGNNKPEAIGQLLANIFRNRDAEYGVHNDYGLKHLLPPTQLKGLDSAVTILADAAENQKRILIIGDFDADGATSTALAIRCLTAFGFRNVDYLVPNRFVYGYGLTPEIVEAAREKAPDIIVTVDNGISSIAGVNTAKSYGIDVVVTDHHLPGKDVPAADAIVNPNQRGCEFPSKHLAGVGVIFYVMSALRKRLRECSWFERNGIGEPNMASYLDIVALGTVADVVPLDYNNRILVAAGLAKMRRGQATAGIQALFNIANRDPSKTSASDLGFTLGPRLNAAGRLDDMSLGIRCLLTDSFPEALTLAKELDDLNRDRKLIESSMQQEALTVLARLDDTQLAGYAHGVCLYKADWHQGVIGILASRIKDRMHRPTIIFAQSDSGELKGSGRSIPGVHIRDVLDQIASHNPGLIEKFGGHAMAAGLSIAASDFERFQEQFNLVVETYLSEENINPVILSDGELPEAMIDMGLAEGIREAGPWGQNFPQPVFDGVFQIVQQRIVGEKHLKLVLTREHYSNVVFDAIAFNIDPDEWPNNNAREVELAYHLDINEFRGNVGIQLMVVHLSVVV